MYRLCKYILVFLLLPLDLANCYTANKVWFEFRPDDRFRVYINYTIPELKEFREVYIDFTKKKDAEKFYWNVVRGGDFHAPNPTDLHFHDVPNQGSPW